MQKQKALPHISNLTLSWLAFDTHKDEIRNLRQAVFVEEQGLGDFVLDSNGDQTGLHLGLFDGDALVSCISIYPYERDHEFIRSTPGLDFNESYGLQFSRRVELAGYRSKGLSTLVAAHAVQSAYEYFQPDCIFAILLGRHVILKNFYISNYWFNRNLEYANEHGDGFLLVLDNQHTLDQLAAQLKIQSANLSKKMNVTLPDLNFHISQNKTFEKYWRIKADEVNRYLNPLSLQDELPRLSAQARMLYKSQKNIWESLLGEYPEHRTILDIGCGPGIYLAQLNKLEDIKDRKLIGMDISDEFITYARFAHSEMDWNKGSVYNTEMESGSVDIVHCSFLFIHLIHPFWALQEINRILAPGGLLYITDINDDTFEGPELIADLMDAHGEIYEGNRKIMSSIDQLTEQFGLNLIKNDRLLVDNTGVDEGADLTGRHYRLGKWSLWAMFSFLGQREEVREQFEQAELYYFDSDCTISFEVQSKIYQKKR